MNRILTLEIEIVDEESAYWIWENHMKNITHDGIYIRKIQEGEIDEQMDKHES